MKIDLKNQRGISLITLSIAVIIIVILGNILIYNVKDNLKIDQLKSMQNDIENLSDKVSSYYAQYGKAPLGPKYTNKEAINKIDVISPVVDTGEFYILDLGIIENLTLNYGLDYEKITHESTQAEINALKDIYIINEASQNIFYLKGIQIDNEMFYTNYTKDDIDTKSVNLKYVEGVKIPKDFYYVGGTKAEGIVISDVLGDDMKNSKQGNQFVWIPVENYEDFKRTEGYLSGNLDTVFNSTSEANGNGTNSKVQEDQTIQQETKEMYASVKEYKGFYIGRYEAGTEGVTRTSSSTISDNVVVKKDKPVYNYIGWSNSTNMTQVNGGAVEKARKFATKQAYTGIKSTLCYGVQWDAVMNFIDPNYITNSINGKPNCSEDSYVRDSTGKGNYNENENVNSYKGNLTVTGNNNEYKFKNIYDMAGNASEWTMESNNAIERIQRGGKYTTNGKIDPSSRRTSNSTISKEDYIGFRIALYMPLEEKWSQAYDKEGIYSDKNGDKAYIPQGCLVSLTPGMNTIDEGLVMKDQNNNEWVWIEVPKKVYIKAQSADDYANIESDLKDYTKDYAKAGFSDNWYNGCGIATEQEYNNLKNKMYKSLYENGGFYIARYEAGVEDNVPRTSHTDITDTSVKAVSKVDMIPYNYVYVSEAQLLASKMKPNNEKQSSLMFGVQWDLVCKFIESKNAKTQDEITRDSTSFGNYLNSSFILNRGKYSTTFGTVWLKYTDNINGYVNNQIKEENQKVFTTTGASEQNKILNIYDLAGNELEWTLERKENDEAMTVNRGGNFDVTGIEYHIAKRINYSMMKAISGMSFRATMYK